MEKQPNMPSPEEVAKIEKERTLSDAKFIKDGAEYVVDEDTKEKRLDPTNKQIEVESGINQERYEDLLKEFDRQTETLIEKYKYHLSVDEDVFLSHYIEPLKEKLKELSSQEFKEGHIPFVIVTQENLVGLADRVAEMEINDNKGCFNTEEAESFDIDDNIEIPESPVYIVTDIEDGKTTLGEKNQNELIKQFKKESRSPLTHDEGIALITHYPEILNDHNIVLSGSYRQYYNSRFEAYLFNSYKGVFDTDKGSAHLDYQPFIDDTYGTPSCGDRIGSNKK
jgi:hypothetical protein